MKIPFYKRASFWKTIIQAFQVGLSSVQGITLFKEEHVMDFNIWIAVIQGVLAMISILTVDADKDDIVDLVQDKVTTTVTVTAPADAEVIVDKTETKIP